MEKEAFEFLEKIFSYLQEYKIVLNDWRIDHLCYRTSSQQNYEITKSLFEKKGDCLFESEVNGRMIATYKLFDPIEYKGHIIDLVEVPAPKIMKETPEGFEHIEVVVDISFEEILNLYPHCQFEKNALQKKVNPELEIEFKDCSIKFHHQSLEDIIIMERGLS